MQHTIHRTLYTRASRGENDADDNDNEITGAAINTISAAQQSNTVINGVQASSRHRYDAGGAMGRSMDAYVDGLTADGDADPEGHAGWRPAAPIVGVCCC